MKKAAPLKLAALRSKAKYWDFVVKDAEEKIKKRETSYCKPQYDTL